KLPSTANHKNKNGGCPITPAVRESSIVLQTVYQLLHNADVGLFQSINKVTVIDRFPAAGIAPLVHAGGQHRALPVVGIVHERDQAPIGGFTGVVGQGPKSSSQAVIVAVGPL